MVAVLVGELNISADEIASRGREEVQARVLEHRAREEPRRRRADRRALAPPVTKLLQAGCVR
jgi:hypothetical protein